MFKKVFLIMRDIQIDKPNLWFLLYAILIGIIALCATLWSEYLTPIALGLAFVVLLIATLVTWLIAALAVFRAFLIVGAGLSLLLFIAQEYCGLPIQERIADDSLQSLIVIGVIFMSAIFAFRVYKELFGDEEAKNEFNKKGALQVFRESNQGKQPVLALLFYATFVGLIISQVFQVLYPIFSNLCVYN